MNSYMNLKKMKEKGNLISKTTDVNDEEKSKSTIKLHTTFGNHISPTSTLENSFLNNTA